MKRPLEVLCVFGFIKLTEPLGLKSIQENAGE